MRWGLVVLVGLGLALTIDLARTALATDQVAWGTIQLDANRVVPVAHSAADETPAWVNGQTSPRPRLIRFTTDWCGPCETMKAQVFAKARVADAIHERFDAYSVDLTNPSPQQDALGQRYRVLYLPTLLVTDAEGRELARLEQAVGAVEFLDWLDRGWQRWASARPSPPDAAAPGASPMTNTKRVN